MKKLLTLTALTISLTTTAQVQLVKDINPGGGDAFIFAPRTFNNKIFFSGDDGVHGKELWVTDGTSAGTHMVWDANPGIEDGVNMYNDLGPFIVSMNGKIYFDAIHKGIKSLCVTDGTEAGTTVVKNVSVDYLTTANGKLYFADANWAPWISDGTEAGTYKLKDITSASNFIAFNNAVYFTAASTTPNMKALWRTDGTEAGTVIVKEVKGVNWQRRFGSIYVANNKLFFSANDGNGPLATLWVSDGTDAGTLPLTLQGKLTGDVNTGVVLNDKLYFYGLGDALCQTDGTTAGTKIIAPLVLIPNSPLSIYANKVIFENYIGNDFYELRTADAVGNTETLTTYKRNGAGSGIRGLTVCNGLLYFTAADSLSKTTHLWATDGTPAGTTKVVDNTNEIDALISTYEMATLNKTLYFRAAYNNTGYELYKMDAPALSVKNATTQTQPITIYPNPANNLLNIDLPQAGKHLVSVMSITGQVLLQQHVAELHNTLNISTMPEGMYLLQVAGNGAAIHQQFIKQ